MEDLVKRLEIAVRQQEVSIVMQYLQVMQLDGTVNVAKETLDLYLKAFRGEKEKVEEFIAHVVEKYFT